MYAYAGDNTYGSIVGKGNVIAHADLASSRVCSTRISFITCAFTPRFPERSRRGWIEIWRKLPSMCRPRRSQESEDVIFIESEYFTMVSTCHRKDGINTVDVSRERYLMLSDDLCGRTPEASFYRAQEDSRFIISHEVDIILYTERGKYHVYFSRLFVSLYIIHIYSVASSGHPI